MNKDINKTLMALVPILRMNGENVTNIEAVHDWYKAGDREYMKEVAEITYDNDTVRYADIGCDSNLTAIYDVIAVIQQIKPRSKAIERIERGVYSLPSVQPESTIGQLNVDDQSTKTDVISRQMMLDGLASIAKAKAKSDAQKSLMGRVIFFTEHLPSVQPQRWIPVSEALPEDLEAVNITWVNHEPEPYYHDIKDKNFVATGIHYCDKWYWYSTTCADFLGEYGSNEVEEVDDAVEIIAWMPLPEPWRGGQDE